MVDAYTLIESGPAYTPLRFGLFSAASLPASSERWRMGIQRVQPPCLAASSLVALPCTGAPVTGAPSDDTVISQVSTVFRVYSWLPCAVPGWGNDLSDLRNRTQLMLTNGEARAVEAVFWTGETSDGGGPIYPHLQANADVFATAQGAHQVRLQQAADTLTSAPVDAVEAIMEIEAALADCYGGEGVIHVPRRALAQLDRFAVVRQAGQQLCTLGGNVVAAYSPLAAGGPPSGAAPSGTGSPQWFYGTGPVEVFRGPIQDYNVQPADFIGSDDNSTVYVVGRDYTITYDCCLVAAEAVLGGEVAGVAGAAT